MGKNYYIFHFTCRDRFRCHFKPNSVSYDPANHWRLLGTQKIWEAKGTETSITLANKKIDLIVNVELNGILTININSKGGIFLY